MSHRPTKFPLAEGTGVFFGMLAWDLLSDGHPLLFRALLVAAPCAVLLYALRCWRRQKPK